MNRDCAQHRHKVVESRQVGMDLNRFFAALRMTRLRQNYDAAGGLDSELSRELQGMNIEH